MRLAPHLLVGVSGPSLTGEERALLSKYPPAGIVLFGRNAIDESQLQMLTTEIRAHIAEASGLTPILAADHEGGRISVLSRAVGVPPSQMAIARTGTSLCRRVYKRTALLVRACGINMFLGPVADINSEPLNPVIGTRSFGEDKEDVSTLVSACIGSLHAVGLLTCLKHFPGHGSSSHDSHLTLPVLGHDVDGLRRGALAPFATGIRAGADSVMVGHIAPKGSVMPASLDGSVVTDLLRVDCEFGGVVMTDALEMAGAWMREREIEDAGALDREYGGRDRTFSDVLELALEAGNDLLLFSRPVLRVYEELESCLSGIKESDRFWHDRFAEISAGSLERIGKLRRKAEKLYERSLTKGSLNAGKDAFSRGGATRSGKRSDTWNPYREVAEKSIRVIRDPRSLLPISLREKRRVMFLGEKNDFDNIIVRRFMELVTENMAGLAGERKGVDRAGDGAFSSAEPDHVMSFKHPDTGITSELYAIQGGGKSTGVPGIVFLLNRRPLTADALAKLTADTGIVVVCGWPYAAELLPQDTTVLLTYGIYDAAAYEVVRRLAEK